MASPVPGAPLDSTPFRARMWSDGAPAVREVSSERRPAATPAGTAAPSAGPARVIVDVEAWTYDFGPQRFRSIVTLENGSVVRS
jgi:hypothetical protein